MFDPEAMRRIAHELFASRIVSAYGPAGGRALRDLLVAVNNAHRQVPYEIMTKGMTVIAPLDVNDEPLARAGSAEIAPEELRSHFEGSATIQILPDGRLRVWPEIPTNMQAIAEVAVVYHYDKGDYFFLDNELVIVPNPTGFPSAFGIPTFVDLDHALAYYANALARYSTCQILQACWFDSGRILLANKPEAIMRSSLAQYLRSTLRNYDLVEVREEQNVDESHPVDIKVTWSRSNRIAIIEVKWLGKSVSQDGERISVTYRDPRAREGAKQLADYLEENLQRAPLHITMGYLVVFDARRNGVGDQIKIDVSRDDAMYYSNVEINYDPRYEDHRSDFASPLRIYLAPKNLNVA